ncbi:MAG: ABC transporter permease [Anaerolineales bacterium]|nr:ABC transporter permease [Anaerolineales bacterium]
MRNIFIVIKHEIITTLGKRSFWVMTFLFPILILALSVGMQTVGTNAIEQAEEAASSVEQTANGLPVGYVDEPGVIDTLPDWVPDGYLQPYPDETAAKAALRAGDIHQYYLIPSDFYLTGDFILVDRNFQPLRSSGNAEIFSNILGDSLVLKDQLGPILLDPTARTNAKALAPVSGPDEDDPFTYIVPMATLFIFFFVITTSASFMLNSVTKEKENRTAETLLVSLEPRQLMAGKVIGLGVIALFQMVIWLSGSLAALNKSGQFFSTASDFSLPEGFIFWALMFFIFGYFLYASILGSIGVLAPNAREGGQFTFVAILPLLVPLWFNYTFTESPDGPVAVFLSLFPLTAPSSMMTRLTTGNVPLWQLLVSLTGLALTAYLFVHLASRLFRADTLLSLESINWKRLKAEIRKPKA